MRFSGGLWAAAAAICGVLALPGLASANLYCVGEPSCTGGTSEGSGAAGLAKALTSAEGHAGSTVTIGPGTYTQTNGFEYKAAGAVTIRGSGRGSTIISSGNHNATGFKLESEGSTLAAVTVEVPSGEELEGILLDGGTVEQTAITGGGDAISLTTGLKLEKGVFKEGSIELNDTTGTSRGVEARGGEVLSSTISASYGYGAALAGTVRGCRITSSVDAVEGTYADPLVVEDSLLYVTGSPEGAVMLESISALNTVATLRGLTIIDGNGTAAGVQVRAREGTTSTVTLEDSVTEHVAHPIREINEGTGSSVTVTTDYSSYPASADVQETRHESESGATIPVAPTDENPVAATPDFISPVFGENGSSEGNWRLLVSSPLIGAGKPGPLAAGEFATDLAGKPRVVDGLRDVGAYQYQRPAPAVSASATPLTVVEGTPVSFTGSALASEPGDSIAGYQWSFDDGASVPAGATATHAFSTPGKHTATLTAMDVLGVKGTATVSVTVEARSTSIRTDCVCGGSRVLALSLKPRSLAAAHAGASVTHKAHAGARVNFELSRAATVDFSVQRLVAGFTDGRKCVASRHGGKPKRCTRRVSVHGSFSYAGASGANSFRFSGRIGGHALAPGRYLLVARVAGSGTATTVPFTIVA